MILIRRASPDDDAALVALDDATWSPLVQPSPQPPTAEPFFGERKGPEDVLVAVADGAVVGYAQPRQPTHDRRSRSRAAGQRPRGAPRLG